MTSDKMDALMNKIRALMAKTVANGCTEEEAALAAEKVSELLTKYNLDMRKVEQAAEAVDHSSGYMREDVTYSDTNYDRDWRRHLLYVISKNFYCRFFIYGKANPRGCIIGQKHNVEVVNYFFNSLADQLKLRCEADLKKRVDRNIHSYYWKRSYLMAAATVIDRRLQAMRQAAANDTKALVLSVESELDKWVSNNMGPIRESKGGQRKSSTEGYAFGARAGEEAALNPGINGRPSTNHKQLN